MYCSNTLKTATTTSIKGSSWLSKCLNENWKSLNYSDRILGNLVVQIGFLVKLTRSGSLLREQRKTYKAYFYRKRVFLSNRIDQLAMFEFLIHTVFQVIGFKLRLPHDSSWNFSRGMLPLTHVAIDLWRGIQWDALRRTTSWTFGLSVLVFLHLRNVEILPTLLKINSINFLL